MDRVLYTLTKFRTAKFCRIITNPYFSKCITLFNSNLIPKEYNSYYAYMNSSV